MYTELLFIHDLQYNTILHTPIITCLYMYNTL